jgi:integrase
MSVRKRVWTGKDGSERMAWVVAYKDGEAKRRLKTFKTQREAKAWASRTEVAVEQGTHVPDRATVTVSKAADLWIETCEANGLERTTIDAYRAHLKFHIKPLIGDALLSKVTVPFVRGFEDEMRLQSRTAATIKRVVGSLGAIISDAQERGLAAHNAVKEMRGSRGGKQRRIELRHKEQLRIGVDIPSAAEVKAFVGALEGRWKPLLMTAAFCGLRSSELRGLPWDAVDLAKRELRVYQRADRFGVISSPKSKQGRRVVPIPAGLAQVLREWRLICPKAESGQVDAEGNPVRVLNFVFPNGSGKVEGHGNVINRGFLPAMIAAGVTVPSGKRDADGAEVRTAKYTGLHSLRHFYASWCINPISAGGMGLSPKEVQERMGHGSIVMTMDRYGHLFPRGDASSEIDAAERALLG